jgi:hypothetical protein
MINIRIQIIKAFNLANFNIPVNGQGYGSPQTIPNLPDATQGDSPLYISKQGTPVFSDLDIEAGKYIDFDGSIKSYPGIKIPTVLITARRGKNVVTTSMNGLDGTVKQHTSNKDWEINVKGIITGANGKYPATDMSALRRILDSKASITVNSWYLSQLGVYMMTVIDEADPQVAGGYSQQVFEFTALSDKPVDLF